MATVGKAVVKIKADTSAFEKAIERTMAVHFIYAIREVAFLKGMTDAQRAAFGDTKFLELIDETFPQTIDELHAVANQMEEELRDQPAQEGMDLP